MDFLEMIGAKATPTASAIQSGGFFGFLNGQAAPSMRDKDTLLAYKGWVYSCVNAISENVADIHFALYRKSGENIIEIKEHIALDLLYNVNPNMTSSDLLINTQSYLELNGNSFWYLPRGSATAKPAEIWPLDPTNVIIVKDPVEFVKGYIYKSATGKYFELAKTDIIHFKRFNPNDPYRGIGTVMAAALAIDIDNYSQIYNKNFFFNSAVPSAALETEGTLTPEQYTRLKTSWESHYKGLDNAHKLAILEGGLKYNSISPTAREMQFLEQRRFSRDEILGIFRVPKTILGITEDVNRANAEASEYVFAKRVVQPRMSFLIDRLNEFYLPLFGDDKLYFDYESPVPQDDSKTLAENTASVNKWITVNEVREEKGLDPVKNGDGLYIESTQFPLGVVQSTPETPVKTKAYQKDKIDNRIRVLTSEVKKQVPIFEKLYKQLGDSTADNITSTKSIEVKADKDNLLRAAMGGAFVATLQSFKDKIGDVVTDMFIKGGVEGVLTIDASGTFDLKNPRAVSWLNDHALESAKSVESTAREEVKNIITSGVSEGKSIDDIAKELRVHYDENSKFMAERLARTETAKGYSEGSLEGYRQMDVSMKQWITAGDDRVSADCLANEKDGPIELESSFDSGDSAPPVHPNAVLSGSTFYSYGELEEMVGADYEGPAVLIKTSEGKELTIGPNHPILTFRGMIKARDITKEDKLIYDKRINDPSVFGPQANFKEVPLVENCFITLNSSGRNMSIATSSHDLHGDRVFCKGEIKVINPANGLLPEINSVGLEQYRESGFMESNMETPGLSSDSSSNPGPGGIPLTSTSEMRSILPSNDYLVLSVHSIDYITFKGKAFDATTRTGIYNSNGFVVSNCRCALKGITGDEKIKHDYHKTIASAKSEVEQAVKEGARDILIVKQRAEAESQKIVELAIEESKKIVEEARAKAIAERESVTKDLISLRKRAIEIAYGTDGQS